MLSINMNIDREREREREITIENNDIVDIQRGDELDGDGSDEQAEDQGSPAHGLWQLHLHHDGHEGDYICRAQHPTR